MKFIHTSDWHLGRLFHNVSLLDDQQHLLDQVFHHLQEQEADALVVAGDIYDRSVPPATAVEVLDEFLHRVIQELRIPVILIPGNHDSAERLGFGSRQLQQSGLHILADLKAVAQPVTLEVKGVKVDFFGLPYADPAQVRSTLADQLEEGQVRCFNSAHQFLVEQVKQAVTPGRGTVLLSHCFLDGASESDSERPLAIGGADRVDWQPLADFDYVALGHLHSPQYKGKEYIRYSGSLMKYSFSEATQKKSLTLVEVNQQGLVGFQLLPLEPRKDLRILEGDLQSLLQQGETDPHREDFLLVRLTDREALLEPMSKLRRVYPNVLHLEKTGLTGSGDVQLAREKLKRGELDLFSDFYRQVQGEELSAQQVQVIQEALEEIRREETQG
ncbi:exonuclease SbcCD subunit D [Marinospirillum sp.]|uniref:exonuclease SbcCD subunit D n=2 Tax=Marinospirillum sp. TaxID=2183934 RepID=UPI00384E10F9